MGESLAMRMAAASKEDRDKILQTLSEAEITGLNYDWRFWGRPEQFSPEPAGWVKWLYLAGRGAGKTRSGAEWIRERVTTGKFRHIALVAPTTSDARDVMLEGESGLLNIFPPNQQPFYEPSKRKVTFYNGAIGHLYTADKPDRLRGPQHDTAWADELAAWRYPEAWDMLMFGLRLGQDPKVVITTTPKPKRILREILQDPTTVITKGSTYDNVDNLAPAFMETIIKKYEGTTLGQQELHAVLLEEDPSALWQRKMLDPLRLRTHPSLQRIVVGVDPNVKNSDDDETTNECGIIVAGTAICSCKQTPELHVFVISDDSARVGPNEWATRVIKTFHQHRADRVVPEVNQGGDLVTIVLRTIDPLIPITPVFATRGKATRAEPVAALYEQGKVHHVGSFPELEDQMCTWVPGEGDSPDRLDALVWSVYFLMLAEEPVEQVVMYEDRVNISPY